MSRKEKTYHFIYKTTDTRNGNFYVGMHSTDKLNDGYIGSGTRLRRLIYKHGKEIFNMEILEFLPDRSSLKQKEKEIVNSDLLKEEKCINLKEGGEGGFCNDEHRKKFFDGHKNISVETFKERRKKQKDYWDKNPELYKIYCTNLSKTLIGNKHWVGHKHKEDSKKTIGLKSSKNQTGNKNSQYNTCWITNGFENKKIKKDALISEGWKYGRIFNNMDS
jgi:hypothetical protein